MKVKKGLLTVLIAVIFISANIQAVMAAGSAEFITDDRTTRGDWVGTYGSEGYIVFSRDVQDNIPGYASLEFLNEWQDDESSLHVWYDESDGAEESEDIARRKPGALFVDSSKSHVAAGCRYNGPEHFLVVDVGSETKYVTVYHLDWDEQSRVAEITVRDEADATVIDTFTLENYSEGVYLRYQITGKVIFEFVNLTEGQNSVYSGIFFDPVPAEEAEEVPEATAAAAEEEAQQAPPVTPVNVPEPPAAAPQTNDGAAAIGVMLSLAGMAALSVVRRKIKIK